MSNDEIMIIEDRTPQGRSFHQETERSPELHNMDPVLLKFQLAGEGDYN
jgi:hypothetical protein